MEMEKDVFNSELGRKILALTKASFKVSDLIPDLVLREKIKHQILEVYKSFFVFNTEMIEVGFQSKNYQEFIREIDILDYYFYLGGHLNLIKEEHLKQLRNGFLVFKSHIVLANYSALKHSVNFPEENSKSEKKEKPESLSTPDVDNVMVKTSVENLNEKQKKILEKFNSKNTLKLAEIMELFPDVSERTIRNELTFLINLGKITRDGRGNGSFYKIIDSRNQ